MPTTPDGGVEKVKVTEAVTISVIEVVAMPLFASITLTEKVVLPVVVGVPDSSPVDAFSVNPGGRLPLLTDQVNGLVPPLTVSWLLYATFASPLGGAANSRAGPVL